jgi:phosphoglucosamine mutase
LGLERTKVGDRYVTEAMRAKGYNIGGEQSGHIVLSDFSTTGDGLIAALQVLAVMVESGRPMSEVCHLFEPAPQILENVAVAHEEAMADADVVKAIKASEQLLGNRGRLLVRKSGTEPVVRVMAEGDEEPVVRRAVANVVAALAAVRPAA